MRPDDPCPPKIEDEDPWEQDIEKQSLAAREGKSLDPSTAATDPRGGEAHPTAYLSTRLLISTMVNVDRAIDLLREAARSFNWDVEEDAAFPRIVIEESQDDRNSRAERYPWAEGNVGLARVVISATANSQARPPDAWSLLQAARALGGDSPLIHGIGLDHILQSSPFTRGAPLHPRCSFTRGAPFTRGASVAVDSYAEAGAGGRQPVSWVGPAPRRGNDPRDGERRVRVGVLDSGCGSHSWFAESVRDGTHLLPDGPIGKVDATTNPETLGNVSGPLDGSIDDASGHGTFIVGLVRQGCPKADVVWWRVMESDGTLAESEFVTAIARIAQLTRLGDAGGGLTLDVLNLSFGYYHETPYDLEFDPTLYELLALIGRTGTVVVCAAGNDATSRPLFPAAFGPWEDPTSEVVRRDPRATPIVSIGALNPNGRTDAMFSNAGPWVHAYRHGAALVSTIPPFEGGLLPIARATFRDRIRESIDPDDFTGGFAVWSGTSFAAPVFAAELATKLAPGLATSETAPDAVARASTVVAALLNDD